MSELPAIVKSSSALQTIESIIERAEEFARNARASNTSRAYASDLRDFAAFCSHHGLVAFPATPQTVALYLADLSASKTVATLQRRMVAIAQLHKNAGLANPVADPHVRAIVQGIRRSKGTGQRKKAALTSEHLTKAILTSDAIDASTLMGKRDKAILLLTFAMAGRRSEIAALNVEDLRYDAKGLVVIIRRSKTDQTGEGVEIGVPMVKHEGLCAVRAVAAWLEASGIKDGPLFRSFGRAGRGQEQPLTEKRIEGQAIARLIKRVCGKAGIDGDFSAHSLRAGFITQAASTKGVSEVDIQRVSRHRSVAVLRGYVRRANVFEDAPLSAMLGNAA
jgi:integrase